MAKASKNSKLIKIVYFDEESVSDLLDMEAGGKELTSKQQGNERVAEVATEATVKAAAKFNWLPFFGGSAEAGAAASASALGRSILNKTLSNTILTDYLDKRRKMSGIVELEDLTLTAQPGSAAHTKMFTPYMAMVDSKELPINLAALDAALLSAKGYYELVGKNQDGTKCILRFNIQAFRNNYGLVDLGRMNLVFHGVLVGKALESSLSMEAEMNIETPAATSVSAREALGKEAPKQPDALNVYDVLLAGVQHAA
ncbi:DUF6414 family protein [Leucobacter sp. GX0328]